MSAPVNLPAGFSASAVKCGVKPGTDKLDLALFISDRPCSAAGVFTTNLVCGAPVKVCRERLPRATARGVVVNSGNANACTGEQGLQDAREMAALVGAQVGCAADDILVFSTGVIGRLLPMPNLAAGIQAAAPLLSPSAENFHLAARAMMTTDTFPKQVAQTLHLGGKPVQIAGVCKGAAMIAPNMATMLCVIMTDAVLPAERIRDVLAIAARDSFNCISVDGHESTSDSVVLLANGASGVAPQNSKDWALLQAAIDAVAQELAQMIIRDAEGAHHFVQIEVTGCRTRDEAFRIAKSVADSPLVKTAICGADPNWGRVVSAAGYAGVDLKEVDISLTMNGFALYEKGTPLPFDAAAVSKSLRDNRETHIALTLTLGQERVRFWTSDLTKEYVELNADYTT